MISEISPIAFRRSTMPSVKPQSSTRNEPITLARRRLSPSCSSRIVRPSRTADQASAGAMLTPSALTACATQAGETKPADDAFAGIGLQAIDPHGLVRQPLPDRQQQSGDDVKIAVRESGNLGEFPLPGLGKGGTVGLVPSACAPAPPTDRAVRSIGRSRRTRRSTSPSSSMTLGAGTCTAARPDCAFTSKSGPRVVRAVQCLREAERPIALAPADGEDLGLRTGLGMDIERTPIGHHQALGGQRLDADVVGAGGARALDLGLEQLLERAEQRVLQIDGAAPAAD